MAADQNVNIVLSVDSLISLVADLEVPDCWVAGRDVISYGTLENLFIAIDKESRPSFVFVSAVNCLAGRDLSLKIGKTSNFKK